MFGDFSGKGQVGLFTPGNVQETSRTRVVHGTIDGKGIEYWHAYATGLAEGVKGLIDEKDHATKLALERKAIDAGLRAVIRVALAEIRKLNPNHPLLDKKNRDRIFAEFEKQEMDKILARNGLDKIWDPRKNPEANQSE